MARAAAELPDAATGAPRADEPATCRNCGASAPGAFCPACGQETSIALPSARQFLKDAAGRYVAFDGRMWRTLAALLFRPGFLTQEYFAGRRRRYVRPARLFLVLSLVMFLAIRFAVGTPELADGMIQIDRGTPARASEGASAPSSVQHDGVAPPRARAVPGANPDATKGRAAQTAEIDSTLLALPGLSVNLDPEGDVIVNGAGAVADVLRQRMARFNALPRQERFEQLVLGTLRYGPYAMFVLLPAFALLLMSVYAGRHRAYPSRPRRYAEHLVFAAHYHALLFLIVTIAVLVPWGPFRLVLALWGVAYGLLSLRAAYAGRWSGLLVRAWCLSIAYFVLFAFVTVGLVVAAVVIR
jgi:hypothetical protein